MGWQHQCSNDAVATVACPHGNQHDFIDMVHHPSSEDVFVNAVYPVAGFSDYHDSITWHIVHQVKAILLVQQHLWLVLLTIND